MNLMIIDGNLTKDPVLRRTEGGTVVVEGTIANTERRKDREDTIFLSFTMFGASAETFERFFSKGKYALLEGKLREDTWEKNGETKYKKYLLVNNWSFGGAKKENSDEPNTPF